MPIGDTVDSTATLGQGKGRLFVSKQLDQFPLGLNHEVSNRRVLQP
jgi:hypothetical protein